MSWNRFLELVFVHSGPFSQNQFGVSLRKPRRLRISLTDLAKRGRGRNRRVPSSRRRRPALKITVTTASANGPGGRRTQAPAASRKTDSRPHGACSLASTGHSVWNKASADLTGGRCRAMSAYSKPLEIRSYVQSWFASREARHGSVQFPGPIPQPLGSARRCRPGTPFDSVG